MFSDNINVCVLFEWLYTIPIYIKLASIVSMRKSEYSYGSVVAPYKEYDKYYVLLIGSPQ